LRKRKDGPKVCIVSLASQSVDLLIKEVSNKRETVLIADAFDEDPRAQDTGRARLSSFLEAAADFKSVIITCRSQYFTSDDAIPRETPLAMLIPRKIGQSPTFALTRSYISPFDKAEIKRYISRHFPLYKPWLFATRQRAVSLVEKIPDLSYRPMLLERLPELATKPVKSAEIFDLYEILVDGWLVRESKWIDAEALKNVSWELALRMYSMIESRRARLTKIEIEDIANEKIGKSPNWKHLTARSLLNRDSKGNYKFAHKSILEFLIVQLATQGDERALEYAWTPFMKDLFISWGHTDAGRVQKNRAQRILKSDEGRKNVAPLFDLLGNSAVRGIPNFKTCCERRQTTTGERLSPAAWRSSSITIENQEGRGLIRVIDREYNLNWSFFPNDPKSEHYVDVKLSDSLRFTLDEQFLKLPSFEQFVALAEGLYRVKQPILPKGRLFLMADKPSSTEHLVVEMNSDPRVNRRLKTVDKQRRIAQTNVYLNSYVTGIQTSPDFASALSVCQLYIHEEPIVVF
jgi:hypothetical protein